MIPRAPLGVPLLTAQCIGCTKECQLGFDIHLLGAVGHSPSSSRHISPVLLFSHRDVSSTRATAGKLKDAPDSLASVACAAAIEATRTSERLASASGPRGNWKRCAIYVRLPLSSTLVLLMYLLPHCLRA
ncbi:hypothetical protein FA95DRAFT_1289463 [Auriscalpium vulgare]|uniref:Uncharacterized protein n=1 Tax=Auriscalpium vulgare TaxID=40419 RepID=A0ACB8RT45_9AGAM|nr:hypothetical protein FA95DRAFT_1289463 [Auriscalpium vulgare]